jgi:hypothetical protein
MHFDLAWSLPDDEALAYAIAFGEMDGHSWDWGRMAWKRE